LIAVALLWALFGLVLLGPWCLLQVGPGPGALGSVIGLVAWQRLGPSPMPGLLPGLMGVSVLGSNLGLIAFALWPG